MKKSVKTRFILIFIAAAAAVIYLLPNTPVYNMLPAFVKNYLPERGITLGLDLQGGMYLVYEVEVKKAVELTANRRASRISKKLEDKKIEAKVKTDGIHIVIDKTNNEIKQLIENDWTDLRLIKQDSELVYALSEEQTTWIENNATEQALETIRNRIDQFGVAEPIIQRQSETEIVVQLPGVKDPKRAMELIGKTALLEFKLVDDENELAVQLPNAIAPDEEMGFLEKIGSKVSEDHEILFQRTTNETGQVIKRPFLLKKESLLTGDSLTEATVAIDQRYNEPYVSISFNSEGSKIFSEITEKNVRKRMAIILDDTVYSAPVIQEKISGGSAQITGRFGMQEAKDLAIVLRAGSLPAPVKVLQNLTVGPSLGRDSIEAGKVAGIAAFILVVVFMIIYYKFSGLIADFAMTLNILLLLGAMASLNATLTMPGIAGIILAIGMAVDTNVLMFERIRDEIRSGKTARAAVESGYDRA
ncbi:preprotein translocase subunit SecD, partial [Candidatus Magnetoovum chiemensis]